MSWWDGAGWAAMLCSAGSSVSTQSHASGLGMGVEVPKGLHMGPLWAIIKQEEGTAAGCAVRSIQHVLGCWMGDEENDRDCAAVCPVSLPPHLHAQGMPISSQALHHAPVPTPACAAACPWLKTD